MSTVPTAEEMDLTLVSGFENDLCDMTLAEIDREINRAQDELDEIEPWLEALCAQRRILEANKQETV